MILAKAIDHQLNLPLIPAPIVFVIDDDICIRQSLEVSIRSAGWQVETFESPRAFLCRPRSVVPSCLILSLSLPGLNGLEMQKQIARERVEMPIIMISCCGDVPTTVQAMKAGAVDFLVKPFSNDVLLSALRQSLERSRVALEWEMEMRDLRICYASLSPRERQVMALVVSGLLNKQVGAHRGQVMQKMKANSIADLVRMATQLRPSRQAIHLA
jgi:FixJ family two-component response regulator